MYPKLPMDASIHKRDCAFFMNKAALYQIKKKIPMWMYLDHLGIQLGCIPLSHGFVDDWKSHSTYSWCHSNWLEIISFHNSNGVLLNATIPSGNQVLHLVWDGPVGQCLPSNIAYAKDCHTWHPRTHWAHLPHFIWFFVKLSQSTTTQINGQGNNYELTTFHSLVAIMEMEMKEIQENIFDITHQDDPYTLSTPGFA